MLTICTTRLGTDHSCKVWMKLHQLFIGSSLDKFCDGRTDRRRRSDPYMSPLLRRGDTNVLTQLTYERINKFYLKKPLFFCWLFMTLLWVLFDLFLLLCLRSISEKKFFIFILQAYNTCLYIEYTCYKESLFGFKTTSRSQLTCIYLHV
jgi:hypothetical protein